MLYLLRGFFCLAVVSLAACETSRPIDGKDRDCVGINGVKDSTLVYEYSTRNIIIGLFSAEFIVPPVIVVLKDLECPKRKRVR